MNKKIKNLLLGLALITTLSVSAVKANTINDVDATKKLVSEALNEKTFYKYNLAYTSIMNIKDTSLRDSLLWQLATITDEVWTADIKKYNLLLEELVKTGSGKLYDEMEATISKAALSEIDKAYILGELTSWGRKLVYTADYTAAVDSIVKAWNNLDDASINSAESLVSQVKNSYSKAYLEEELTKIKAKKASGLTRTSTGKMLIYRKDLTDQLNKSWLEAYRTTPDLVESKEDVIIGSAMSLSKGGDILEEIKTKWLLADGTKNHGTKLYAQYVDHKYVVHELRDPASIYRSKYLPTGVKCNIDDFVIVIVYEYPDNPGLYEVHCVVLGI